MLFPWTWVPCRLAELFFFRRLGRMGFATKDSRWNYACDPKGWRSSRAWLLIWKMRGRNVAELTQNIRRPWGTKVSLKKCVPLPDPLGYQVFLDLQPSVQPPSPLPNKNPELSRWLFQLLEEHLSTVSLTKGLHNVTPLPELSSEDQVEMQDF